MTSSGRCTINMETHFHQSSSNMNVCLSVARIKKSIIIKADSDMNSHQCYINREEDGVSYREEEYEICLGLPLLLLS